MPRSSPILRARRQRVHVLRILMVAFFVLLIDYTRVHHELSHAASFRREPSSPAKTNADRIFIASTHWNNAAILRSHWNAAILNLTSVLGPDRVFVSVYESGSWDGSKGALRELDAELEQRGIPRRIVLDKTTHEDEISRPPAGTGEGWIDTPRGKRELRRIPFLSRQRNLSLQPLERLEQRFDRILFLNDVVFTNEDFFELLATNNGEYAAACALDFAHPPLFYDTFALRDSEGHEAVMQTWPYFRGRQSREALQRGEDVPVASCWNGMVIMDAAPFYDEAHPLRFRGIADSLATRHVEGSECCLIHADNPVSAQKGVWLNPRVRVGYSGEAYEAVHNKQEGSYYSVWENRLRRWFTTDRVKVWRILQRVHAWEAEDPTGSRGENGEFCLINEMQVLVARGWAHV